MAAQQRIKVANEKASKNILLRGNVPKSTVSKSYEIFNICSEFNQKRNSMFSKFPSFSDILSGILAKFHQNPNEMNQFAISFSLRTKENLSEIVSRLLIEKTSSKNPVITSVTFHWIFFSLLLECLLIEILKNPCKPENFLIGKNVF